MKKYIILLILAISLFSSVGAQASGTGEGSSRYDWFWFFYESTENKYGESLVYRPFFMELNYKKGTFQASLMPLLFWRYFDNNSDVTKGFFGLYESDDYVHSNKKKDYDSGLFPLFFYGSGDTERDRYSFIYPFGGTVKGKIGQDRISAYAFPGVMLFFLYPPSGIFTWQTLAWSVASLIPAYSEYDFKEYKSWALFWPFIQRGKSSSRDDFRFLPFYAHNYKEGWYDNYMYLLLFNYRHIYLRKDDRYTFFFFPFYGRKWSRSGDASATTILWPFFSWGYDKSRGNREYNLPWPLVQIRDCEKPMVRKRIFFPFYGRYNTSRYESFFVTPLYFRIKKESESFSSAYHINCFIVWYFKRDYRIKHEYYGNSWRYFKIWPLMQVEWSDSGLYSLNILSLLPFRDTAGYEKMYQPFWTLFEYRRKPDGEKHLGLLFRTYYQVWNEDYLKLKVPLLVTYEKRGDNLREFSLLLSAFGYELDSRGKYLKFLWIPFRIGDGMDDGSDQIETAADDTPEDDLEALYISSLKLPEPDNPAGAYMSFRFF